MKTLTISLAASLLFPTAGMANSWSGYLVNSQCYDAEQRSVNPFDTSPEVDRDKNLEIGLCTPNLRAKTFAIVEPDLGTGSFRLDAEGNAKARDLVRATGKKSFRIVTVDGAMGKTAIDVSPISETR